MTKELELSQALSAKICHDLAGAIGTIDNCLSLLENDDKNIRDQAKTLVNSESINLVNSIKFLRSAYGACEGESKMSIISVTKLLKDFIQSKNIKLKLDVQEGILFIETMLAKAIISLTSVATDNINSKGEIILSLSGDNEQVEVTMLAKGKNLAIKEESLRILSNIARSKVNVKNCREFYIKSLLGKLGYKISVNMDSDSLKYIIVKNN